MESVLVLNQSYQPITVTTLERAVILSLQNKATIVQATEGKEITSQRLSMPYPSVIRLTEFKPVPYKKVPLTNYNIFKRDSFKCAYCGSGKELTLDHVIPRAQGGKTQWKNLVTACRECNGLKGDKTPEQAEMPLKHGIPHRPSFIMYMNKMNGRVREDWKEYLYQ